MDISNILKKHSILKKYKTLRKHSIFRKQLITQLTIIITSFLILGVGLTEYFSNFFVNERKQSLLEQGKNIEKTIKSTYYGGIFYSRKKLVEEVEILYKYLDASFIFVDNNYKISIISNEIDSSWLGQTLKIRDLNIEPETSYFQLQGNMGGIFNEVVFTVGLPVYINDANIGIIFISSPMTELKETIQQSYEIIILFILIAIIVSLIFTYVFARKFFRPLIEISEAAQVISNGDFEKRIFVTRDDELGKLAIVFNEMAESLSEQEKRRREFISNISHDIRSPLTSMKGFLQAILDKTIPEDKQEKYIKIVLDEAERLSLLANNILEINKINFYNELTISNFDLNELIRRAIINLEPRIIEKEINVKVSFFEEVTFVSADFDKIQRVIYNLLDNSIKFMENGGEIFIETDSKEDLIVTSIKDTGCGISKNDQKRIFDRFYKTDYSRGQDKKGSGLGLSIVREFILAHNQKIYIESEIGQGTKLKFTLNKSK